MPVSVGAPRDATWHRSSSSVSRARIETEPATRRRVHRPLWITGTPAPDGLDLEPSRKPTAPEPAECLVADVGSTLTKVSAFAGLNDRGSNPRFLGQGMAVTTARDGDVGVGLAMARRDLESRFNLTTSDSDLMAASSAAGGLRMSVHGLTRDMTLRAAKEASLGAGAIVVLATAGRLGPPELAEIGRHAPSLILLAGGVDGGERDVVLANARQLATLTPPIPVIYAGNQAAREEVSRRLLAAGVPTFTVDNVYPRIDELNVEPVRAVIQEVFARHITAAPGMDKLKAIVVGDVVPTPAAVMRSTELLAQALGDVMTVDVGGATTDVHSVTQGSPANAPSCVAPEPRSKRTVEGDLGVYLNAHRVLAAAERSRLDIEGLEPVPRDAEARRIAIELTRWAVDIAVWRHAGERRVRYGALGRREFVEGRDLSAIRFILGTGGALTRLGEGLRILQTIKADPRHRKLLPPGNARALLDRNYVMCAAGVLSQRRPEVARSLLLDSIGLPRPA